MLQNLNIYGRIVWLKWFYKDVCLKIMINSENNTYKSPFCSRYSSKEMLYIFSEEKKIKTWRKLWVALSRAEKELGLPISSKQIKELEDNINIIDYETAKKREKIVKHDVMAQIYAYAKQCKNAAKIIHLGATSCYVTDNADIIAMKEALKLIKKKLLGVIKLLCDFAFNTRNIPCLSYTHLQPAQLTTVGKRAALWTQDFYMDFLDISSIIENLMLLGSKGATGTQASFLELFKKDEKKIELLEKKIAKEMGFDRVICLSGQTYSRKIDFKILSVLSSIAQSSMKFSYDMRILQSFKELEEPFETNQIGSSAMPYKRNPMKSERITALSRYVLTNLLNTSFTAGTQFFERTLDDSANRRIVIPESFLAVDAILNLMLNICSNITINKKVIEKRTLKELPFMATENIMMVATKKGGNRQKIHEKLRKLSMEAAAIVKEKGEENDLIDRLEKEDDLNLEKEEIEKILKPENFIGLSARQVENFKEKFIDPILEENSKEIIDKFENLI